MRDLEKDTKERKADGGTGTRISNYEATGKLIDHNFEEKVRVAREAQAKGKDPAKAVADYMKNIKQ